MNRTSIILQSLDHQGRGIEIGASHKPVAPKRDGFDVQIIDHLNREGLRAKYEGHGVDLDAIEEVDFVWQGESYAELTGRTDHYDWIIASHLIEHTPDLIGFLNDCAQILNDNGVLSLAIPDKRYCFDHYRPITPLSRIIDAHLRQEKLHSAGAVAEYYLNVVKKNEHIAWGAHTPGSFHFVHTLEEARANMKAVREQGAYLDIHAWCFVPSSFRLIMQDLHALGLVPLKEVSFHPTIGHEFFVTLGKSSDTPPQSRMTLLEAIDAELLEGMEFTRQPRAIHGHTRSNLLTRARNRLSRMLR